jgi:ribosome-associated protein
MEDLEIEEEEYFNVRGPSKSSRKRESNALQDLGEDLMALSREQLTKLDLPEELFEAVRIGQSITAHGGLQRQRKFIGKLLRNLDVEPIRAGLVALKGESVELVRLQHQCERWRDRMLSEGDGVVNEFVGQHPQAERQKLRQWMRDAKKEQEAGRPPRAARLLFRYLRDLLLGEAKEVAELADQDRASTPIT